MNFCADNLTDGERIGCVVVYLVSKKYEEGGPKPEDI